jgi:hypothetical protein
MIISRIVGEIKHKNIFWESIAEKGGGEKTYFSFMNEVNIGTGKKVLFAISKEAFSLLCVLNNGAK